MARTLIVRPVVPYRRPLGFTLTGLRAWNPSLALWGVATGVTVSYLLSNTPIFQHDVLIKLPILGSVWVDDTPAEDKPF